MENMPRIFCVTLKETPLRTKGFMELATGAGLKPELFYGILGTKLGLKPKHHNELENGGQKFFMNERAIGCNMSHFLLWNMLQYQPEEEFLIFEDDAIVENNFIEQFQILYKRLPADWQMVYVGWVPYGREVPPLCVDVGISLRIPAGTHAYLVKKSLLADLCSCLMPFQSNIDLTIIHRLLPKIHYYVFDPSLVGQRSYSNVTDPVWTSLVYDWDNDIYGCKKAMLKDLVLKDGWHSVEQDDNNIWRWSKDIFNLTVPENLEALTFECSTPVENSITLASNGAEVTVNLKVGNNKVTVPTNHAKEVTGRMSKPFIPAKEYLGNTDNRTLGICLKSLLMEVGTISIPVTLPEITKVEPPASSFKLDA